MSIVAAEIKFYKAAVNNDTNSNGGVIGSTEVISNILNNLFPNVSDAERVAGVTRYRKMFMRNLNASNLVLESAKICVGIGSLAADYLQIKAGSDIDVQSVASGYTNWCGGGVLAVNATALDESIQVTFEAQSGVFDGAVLVLDDGDKREEITVDGSPSWDGMIATLTLASALQNSFDALDTKVGVIVSLGDIEPSLDSWVETSSLGTFDESTYPLTLFNVGTVRDSWTLTFTSSTAFTVVGATTGSLGAGSILSNFAPVNGTSYYFEIDASGWGGSWAIGDKITFNTVHAAKAIWVKEIVPAGIAAYSNSVTTLNWTGESA